MDRTIGGDEESLSSLYGVGLGEVVEVVLTFQFLWSELVRLRYDMIRVWLAGSDDMPDNALAHPATKRTDCTPAARTRAP